MEYLCSQLNCLILTTGLGAQTCFLVFLVCIGSPTSKSIQLFSVCQLQSHPSHCYFYFKVHQLFANLSSLQIRVLPKTFQIPKTITLSLYFISSCSNLSSPLRYLSPTATTTSVFRPTAELFKSPHHYEQVKLHQSQISPQRDAFPLLSS